MPDRKRIHKIVDKKRTSKLRKLIRRKFGRAIKAKKFKRIMNLTGKCCRKKHKMVPFPNDHVLIRIPKSAARRMDYLVRNAAGGKQWMQRRKGQLSPIPIK